MKHYKMPDTSLDQMLESYQVDHLKEMGKYLVPILNESGIKPPGLVIPKSPGKLLTRKAERIKWIATALKDKALIELIYKKKMTSIEKAALEEAVHNGGELDTIRFKAKYGSLPVTTIPIARYPRSDEKMQFPPITLFIRRKKIFPDLMQALQSIVARPKKTGAQLLDKLPETVTLHTGWNKTGEQELAAHDTHPAAVSDIKTLLQLIDQGKIRVSAKTGRPTKPACKAIRSHLHSADFYPRDLEEIHQYDIQIGDAGIRPFAWTMLIQAGGLAKINGTKLTLSRTGKTALKKAPHEVLKNLWNRWLKNKNFHEMSRIEAIKGQKSKKRPLYKAADSRCKVDDALADLEPGRWITTSDFFTFLHAKGHGFSVVRNDWALYISDSHYGSLGYSHITWEHVDGRFARALLLEYAATLGIIDVALTPPWNSVKDHRELWGADEFSCLSRYDGLYALRINDLGAWILGITDTYEAPVQDGACLCVLANMDITALAELPAPDRIFLDRICKTKSDRVWQLTLDALLKAVEQGIEFNAVTEFLAAKNNGPLPETVETFLKDTARRAGMLENKGEARLIYCKDKTVIQLIANDTVLKKICLAAGNHHIALYKNKEKQFKTRLRKLGYVMGL